MLKKTVLTFAFLTILTTFYGFNAQFSAPATDDALNALAEMHHSLLPEGSYVISAYDNLIRNISEEEGHDWRLMSAIAYHESRFTPDITSRSGARGLMQIMPSVARQFDVPAAEITDPRTNIWLANKLMSKIMSSLRFPEGTPEKDRMSIILASYNSGIGHVNDARRLARLNGELLDKNGKKSIYNCEKYRYLLDAPFAVSARCCYHMKKAPLNKFERQSGRHPITGVLACESKLREQSYLKFGCNGYERKRPLSQPLAFWLEEDILRYLKMTGISYAPIYGDIVESRKKNGTPILKTTGVSRSGCMYCMYGVHLEHEPNRFQLMEKTHPQQYHYCIHELGLGAVLDYTGVPYSCH